MAGVRGFNDANMQMNGNRTVLQQQVTSSQTTEADYVSPWYINYLGGKWPLASQCMYGGSNSWTENHQAYAHGANDLWAIDQNPYSLGFYKKGDLPIHWALAEGWVVGDMYQESVIASTSPNRAMWASGSINVPGGPQSPDQGGNPYIDNNETPGCENGISCYPLKWKTTAEIYEEQGVSWSVFQDADNFDDNPLAWFAQYQTAPKGSALYNKGMKGQSLQTFYNLAANGTLPAVSFIIGPTELSEHPPHSPNDGAWFQRKIAQAVLSSPAYHQTALIVSYDETGGWFDHLAPFHAPEGTAAEWIEDPWAGQGNTFVGPGFRVPFYIISPFTRNGGVYTEHTDHTSQIKFIERWQAAKGKDVKTSEIPDWRRSAMGDLVAAFDFENPDYSVPTLPNAATPHTNKKGAYDGSSYCASKYGNNPQPAVPYTAQEGAIQDFSKIIQTGFKPIRGALTEGRYLTIESGNAALAVVGGNFNTATATAKHDDIAQRWIAHSADGNYGNTFTLQSARDKTYVCQDGSMCQDSGSAAVFSFDFTPSKGYAIQATTGSAPIFDTVKSGVWSIFSVSY